MKSKILEQQVVNEQHTVDQQTFLLFAGAYRQADPIFVIFGGILAQTIK